MTRCRGGATCMIAAGHRGAPADDALSGRSDVHDRGRGSGLGGPRQGWEVRRTLPDMTAENPRATTPRPAVPTARADPVPTARSRGPAPPRPPVVHDEAPAREE